jgi:hypothetical protein
LEQGQDSQQGRVLLVGLQDGGLLGENLEAEQLRLAVHEQTQRSRGENEAEQQYADDLVEYVDFPAQLG